MLRVLTMTAATFGVWSWSVPSVWAKLTFPYSLEFWDFTASVAPFFGYWADVVALPVVFSHYLLPLSKRHSEKSRHAGRSDGHDVVASTSELCERQAFPAGAARAEANPATSVVCGETLGDLARTLA